MGGPASSLVSFFLPSPLPGWLRRGTVEAPKQAEDDYQTHDEQDPVERADFAGACLRDHSIRGLFPDSAGFFLKFPRVLEKKTALFLI